MSSKFRSYFHYLIGYKFQNSKGFVSTAYLDTYNRNFSHGSSVATYSIHDRVFKQFSNSFIQKFTIVFNTKQLRHDRKFLSFVEANNLPKFVMFSYINFIMHVLELVNDFTKYGANNTVEYYIKPVIKRFEMFISSIDEEKYKLPDFNINRLPDVQPVHTYLTREYHKPLPKLYSSFVSAYKPKIGPGYYYIDYDFEGNYLYSHFEPY